MVDLLLETWVDSDEFVKIILDGRINEIDRTKSQWHENENISRAYEDLAEFLAKEYNQTTWPIWCVKHDLGTAYERTWGHCASLKNLSGMFRVVFCVPKGNVLEGRFLDWCDFIICNSHLDEEIFSKEIRHYNDIVPENVYSGPGECVQYLLLNFDPSWVVEVEAPKNRKELQEGNTRSDAT